MNTVNEKETFQVGLVGAGAISAGAYTGGVIDYLVFALDTWYAAKERGDPMAPPHAVQLGVFAGASAGAITAALATGYLSSDQPPIGSPQDAEKYKERNKLFHSWVEQIDIKYLLGKQDLANDNARVISLLDSTVLATIADDGLNIVKVRDKPRAFVSSNFHLLMTVTNLRGVPYAIELNADALARYDMSQHADYVHFRFSEKGDEPSADRYEMRWSDLETSNASKAKMKISALASGAFPVGLAPRTLDHDIKAHADWYSSRMWPVPTPHSKDPHFCVTMQQIPARFGDQPKDFTYSFQCVDGGVMNNEPFELARRVLAGSAKQNERHPAKADRAILMIDPFPSDTAFKADYKVEEDLLGTAAKLFGALKSQARFKPEDLVLAASEEVASRFMIAPRREGKAFPIACGSLGGFGGFLKRDFRSHDFFLGRRNTQRFLRHRFVLPEDNDLFSSWSAAQRLEYCVKDANGTPIIKDGERLLPIIPIMDAAHPECFKPVWPKYDEADLERLMEQAEERLTAVAHRMVDQYFKRNKVFGWVAKAVLWRRKKDVLAWGRGIVEGDLRKMDLM